MVRFLLASMLAVLAATPPVDAKSPNIIFILTDDLGYGDLGVFWQNQRRDAANPAKPWHQTPQLDRMAAEGMVLPYHYCSAPVCAPSRASLLTGMHQGHANVRDSQFDKILEQNHNLASVLKSAGYATGCIGKWGLAGAGEPWPGHPLKRGFDDFFGYLLHVNGHEHYPKEGPIRGRQPVIDGKTDLTDQLDKCYTTDLFTARAKHWIGSRHEQAPDQPFFLYLAYDTPHAALQLPTGPYPAGGGLKGGLQWLGEPGRMINTAQGEIDSWIHPEYAAATWDHDEDPATPAQPWPDVYQRYATSVRRIDDSVGDLIQLLDDLGIGRDTLVVFTSDNGPSAESYLKEPYSPEFFASYGPLSGIKRDCLEGGLRVGALVRWPAGIREGQRSDLPCGHWDWLPTFAQLAGLPAPARSDGRSLVPTLTGRGTQREPLVYSEFFMPRNTPDYEDFPPRLRNRPRGQMQMLRSGGFTGLRSNITSADSDFEIIDTTQDPRQAHDVAPENPALQQQLKEQALRLRRPLADAPRPYDDAPVPAVVVANARPGVLDFSIYQGEWPWLPDFAEIKPAATGSADSLDPEHAARASSHGLRFNGYFVAPVDAEYTFHLRSNGGALLRLHRILLLDNDFHRDGGTVSASIRLRAGYHPLTLDSRHPQGTAPSLQLECSGPELPLQSILTSGRCAAGSH